MKRFAGELIADATEDPAQLAIRLIYQVRCERLRKLSRSLDEVLHAATYLLNLGVKITRVVYERDRAVITVESTPFLWRLFAGDCAWRQRRLEGETTIYTWFAVRYGTRIEWEERQ
ncbi:MAG: hypothetical protein JNK99_15635 [Candidatus Accumulibacter sp.]|uniref:hypothetical protein n=1 Tax=Accumulibacter sp. TaxID=2053492 RepID=UPI001A619AF0|nr:hypothetical protein [Accumulibacter sp.]MBL8396151.1 hypothetical protein [Accumulibacter sp.]